MPLPDPSAPPTPVSRRAFLGRGVTAAVAVAGASAVATAGAPEAAAAVTGASYLAPDAGLHLLRRATYGPTPATVAELRRVGQGLWLERQLAPQSIDDRACDAVVARFDGLRKTISQVRDDAAENGDWDVMFALAWAHIARAAWSKRQLLEVMVDLWSNHFNITCPSSDVWDSRAHFDAAVIRPNALGRFSDLLVAAETHPAMLRYLSNAESTAEAPNENLGRELLELHTVGLQAGYTESDVKNSARILTGLSVSWDTGEFLYRPRRHYVGAVQVMGFSHSNASSAGGYDVADAYLRWLAVQPATARTVARKLAVRFVSDAPSEALVAKLAKVYLANGTAIAPVLRSLFASAEFRGARGAKVRRPFEDMVATLRILGIQPDAAGTKGPEGLYWMLDESGHQPLAWHPPNGYPDVAAAWQSAGGTLARWNMHMNLTGRWWPKELRTPPLRGLLPAKLPATHGALVDALARRLFFRPLAPSHRAAVCAFLKVRPSTRLRPTDEALTWRLPYVVALLLDTPYHAFR